MLLVLRKHFLRLTAAACLVVLTFCYSSMMYNIYADRMSQYIQSRLVLRDVDVIPELLKSPCSPESNISEQSLEPESREFLVTQLTASLHTHLEDARSTENLPLDFKSCAKHNITNYDDSCTPNKSKCLKHNIPLALDKRIESLLDMELPDSHLEALASMRNQLTSKQEVLIIHALSSNHFNETQKMLQNLHEVVFPVLKNFTLVIYDVGLEPGQVQLLKKHCRCTVFTFPFHKFPAYFRTMKCFAWKMFTISAHYTQADVLMWLDASIVTRNVSALLTMIERVKTRGIQLRCNNKARPPNPHYTLPQMFEAFGDSPCAHFDFRQCETTWALFHNEPLIEWAIIRPWLSCAANEKCICPVNQTLVQYCGQAPPNTLGNCMRADQSALSLVMAKLFREKYEHFVLNTNSFLDTHRGQKGSYFADIERQKAKT